MTAQQLKNSILQMAVQGKLVPQDPNDEPASILLERIRKEKEELIRQGKIKREKNPSVIFRGADNIPYEKVGNNEPISIADEVPFEIPESWEWMRLSNVCTKLVDGDHNPPKGEIDKTPFIMASSTNINNDTLVDLEKVRFLSESVFIKENERTQVTKGDIFFTSVGSLGRSCVYQGGLNICFQRSVSVLTTLVYNYYLKYYFDSGYVQQKVVTESTGTAQKGFYLNQMANLLVPIPPYEEQERIVEKIISIIPLFADYDKTYDSAKQLNNTFPSLLKKSILQYAVQGKLVPQDPNDEPASILLERIREEKETLIKAGKIKPDKHESVIFRRENSHYEKLGETERCIDEEIPFEIPENWCWVRLFELSEYIQRGKSPRYSPIKLYPVIAQKCNQWSGFSIDKAQFVEPESVSSYAPERILQEADLLWNSTGLGTLGRMAVYRTSANPYNWAVADSHVTVIRPCKNMVLSEYLYAYFSNPSVQSVIEEQSDGSTKQKELATNTVKMYLVPLPPLSEQHRIVAKIEELLPVVKGLKKSKV